MRLVDDEQAHGHVGHALQKAWRRKALGRHVEQAQLPRPGAAENVRVGGAVLLGVDQRHPIAEAARGKRLDLVLHERHQRRDDDREVVAQQRRELVAERLAGPGGHHHQHVAAAERASTASRWPRRKVSKPKCS